MHSMQALTGAHLLPEGLVHAGRLHGQLLHAVDVVLLLRQRVGSSLAVLLGAQGRRSRFICAQACKGELCPSPQAAGRGPSRRSVGEAHREGRGAGSYTCRRARGRTRGELRPSPPAARWVQHSLTQRSDAVGLVIHYTSLSLALHGRSGHWHGHAAMHARPRHTICREQCTPLPRTVRKSREELARLSNTSTSPRLVMTMSCGQPRRGGCRAGTCSAIAKQTLLDLRIKQHKLAALIDTAASWAAMINRFRSRTTGWPASTQQQRVKIPALYSPPHPGVGGAGRAHQGDQHVVSHEHVAGTRARQPPATGPAASE